MRSRMGLRWPAKSAWSPGKPQVPAIGAMKTRALVALGQLHRLVPGAVAVDRGADHEGRRARGVERGADLGQQHRVGAQRGGHAPRRHRLGAGMAQSSAGTDTSTGPRGGIIAR